MRHLHFTPFYRGSIFGVHFSQHTSVIEAMGVPHTEVARIVVNGREVAFSRLLQEGDEVECSPPVPPVDLALSSLLRPGIPHGARFVVDVNVGRLARLLRMLGFDATYGNHLEDEDLARISHEEERVLLTRDRRLLRRKIVQHGHLVRAAEPRRQLVEVVGLYGLEGRMQPLSRCLVCNTLLVPVAKQRIEHRLEPLTRRYVENFNQCPVCDRVYWSGSHAKRMREFLGAVFFEVGGTGGWVTQKTA